MLRRRILMNGEADYSKQYFTLKALQAGSFNHTDVSVDYSVDGGNTWNTLSAGSSTPTVQAGTKVMFRGNITPSSSYGVGTFTGTKNFAVEGNVMSLLYGDNFVGQVDLSGKYYAFTKLFYGASYLQDAKNLSLPATTLTANCYANMFNGCTALTAAPALPATTLAQNCYWFMFRSCSSLTEAPELPATKLEFYCYYNMFYGCTSLTTAPELPATTLVTGCYSNMFQSCTNLNYIKAMFTTSPLPSYTTNWLDSVASSGTFVKNSAATWNALGPTGIPEGWTVQTASS